MVKRSARLRVYKRRMADMLLSKEKNGLERKTSLNSQDAEVVSDDSSTHNSRESVPEADKEQNVCSILESQANAEPENGKENIPILSSSSTVKSEKPISEVETTSKQCAASEAITAELSSKIFPVPANLRTSSMASSISDLDSSDFEVMSAVDEMRKHVAPTNRLHSYAKEQLRSSLERRSRRLDNRESKLNERSYRHHSKPDLPDFYVKHRTTRGLARTSSQGKRKERGSKSLPTVPSMDCDVEPTGEESQFKSYVVDRIMDEARRQASFKQEPETQSTISSLVATIFTTESEVPVTKNVVEAKETFEDHESTVATESPSVEPAEDDEPYGCSLTEELDELKRDLRWLFRTVTSNLKACGAMVKVSKRH
jgi:hypothetical protein